MEITKPGSISRKNVIEYLRKKDEYKEHPKQAAYHVNTVKRLFKGKTLPGEPFRSYISGDSFNFIAIHVLTSLLEAEDISQYLARYQIILKGGQTNQETAVKEVAQALLEMKGQIIIEEQRPLDLQELNAKKIEENFLLFTQDFASNFEQFYKISFPLETLTPIYPESVQEESIERFLSRMIGPTAAQFYKRRIEILDIYPDVLAVLRQYVFLTLPRELPSKYLSRLGKEVVQHFHLNDDFQEPSLPKQLLPNDLKAIKKYNARATHKDEMTSYLKRFLQLAKELGLEP